jgi:hypothetical protein
MAYVPLIPYLDECGAIYLPGIGKEGSCVRLNPSASSIWRQLISGETVAPETESTRSFLDFLIGSGAIVASKE